MPIKIAARAHELPNLLDRAPIEVRILSLDCFDTLLWRNTQAPIDVFADLGIEGGSILPRMRAEALARAASKFAHDRNEVTIEQIYARLMPKSDPAKIAAAVARELEAEARHCFGFAPVMELIHDAKMRGWQVIVVSDTYLSADELRVLIGRAAGTDIADAIDRVFVSSEHGLSKAQGLFEPVLEDLGVLPGTILHLGDNLRADQTAPALLGLSTVHFEQFDEPTQHRLRLESAAAMVLDQAVRTSIPAYQPHRPLLSMRDGDDPVDVLGHDVIGPIMHGFASWVRDEVDALGKATGRPVKPLFLMRDGYLPMKMFGTLADGVAGIAVAVSRLTASRASFVDADAVRDFLTQEGPKHRPDVLAGLVLLAKPEIAKLLKPGDTAMDLARRVLVKPTIDTILQRSARHADRLIAHLRRAGVEQGDAVMLIDLGYNGTVQNHIDQVLSDRLGVSVAGRYLVLREQEPSGLDKKGYFDTRHYDRRTLETFCASIAVIEQLSTVAEGSVLDYESNGRPIRASAGIKGAQSAVRERVQAAAIAYGGNLARLGGTRAGSDGPDARRQAAGAILARFLFLPMAQEVEVLRAFDHDVNLGTKDKVKLIDIDLSADELRRHGLTYVQSATRMYLPGELQSHGLELNLSMFSSSRLALDLRASDFQVGGIQVPVIMADAYQQELMSFTAYPTHDGYYAMAVPIGAGRFTLGVQLGALCDIVQVAEACFAVVIAADADNIRAKPIPARMIEDGMQPIADGLYRCDPSGLILIPPPERSGPDPMMMNLIFRPVVRRTAVALKLAA